MTILSDLSIVEKLVKSTFQCHEPCMIWTNVQKVVTLEVGWLICTGAEPEKKKLGWANCKKKKIFLTRLIA
jgi:hypothetical protein